MYKNIFRLLILSIFVSNPCLVLADELADSYVIEADKYRQFADSMKVITEINLYKNNELTKKKQYEIYLKPRKKSLVVMKSQSEKGQKVLMLGDKFWLLMPKSRRPIRITPMQKLLGEASTGDIATLNWHEDYTAEFIEQNEKVDILKLVSKRKGTSYKSIKLWLAKNSHKPIKAELYVASGKLAKVASYEVKNVDGVEQVASMTLQDHIRKNRKTVIKYISLEAYNLADKFYNPAYLIKKPKIK